MMRMPEAPGAGYQMLAHDEIPTAPSPTGQYPDPVWADADYWWLIEAAAAKGHVPVPPSPTGQYPDPVWARVDYGATVAALDHPVPIPPSPTGQYPDPVWARVDYGATVAALDDPVPTPPSPTGQYPEPVWSNPEVSESARLADRPARPVAAQVSAHTTTAPTRTTAVAAQSTGETSTAPPAREAPSRNRVEGGESTIRQTLDNENIYRIVRAVAEGISGDDLYEWVDVSQQEAHGLRAGLVGFSQARGELGGLVQIMHSREPALFAEVMGPHAIQLVQTLTSGTQGDRLQPVGGKALWHPDWQAAFRRAGQHEQFRRAQNQAAIELQFRPMLPVARELGLRTDRGLALLYERVLELGLENVAAWMQEQLDPPSGATESARLEALLASAGPERDRLAEVYNSSLLDGTAFEF